MIWGRHALVSSASHNDVLLCTTCVYLVSLDYEISLPHPSPYHTSQQAADLVFEPTMKRSQKREKSNFERNFLAKNNKREKITFKVDFTYVRLCKENVGKIADFGLQFPFNGTSSIKIIGPISDMHYIDTWSSGNILSILTNALKML